MSAKEGVNVVVHKQSPASRQFVASSAAYQVSAADWLTLAEEFSLAPYLEDTLK